MNLTPKQDRFCQEYVVDLNGTQAAIRAGYSQKTAAVIAAENLTKPNIHERINELQTKISSKLGIDAEWITKRFKDISDRCMVAEPVLNRDGMPTGEYIFDSSGANKSTEMLGKMIGVFEKDNSQSRTIITPPPINVYGAAPTEGD